MAKMVNGKGDVSPLCAAKPRKINLKVATWTNRAEAVTCKKCLAALGSLNERIEPEGKTNA